MDHSPFDARKSLTTSGEFPPFCGKRNTKNIQNLQTSQAYIFHILQSFATKLGNFTNFKMLFLAVVKYFAFFAKMKIQFKRGIVHSLQLNILNACDAESYIIS